MLTVTTEHRRRSVLVGGSLAVTALILILVLVAMFVLPDDGCGSWVEQLNFLESFDLCRGNR